MKKSGLRDMKLRNRHVILQAILESGGLSRIEIAQKTELSPSTVTALVGELLEEGILAETGIMISTGGRRRTEVSINREHGSIAIAEIGRKGAWLHLFDMVLGEPTTVTLSESYISGNDLLVAITAAMFDQIGADNIRKGKLAGMGLLFQEDMNAGEFNVVYSTSLSSSTITLKDALVTQFRMPVVEEYSRTYTITDACKEMEQAQVCSAHIALGNAVLAAITINGTPLPLKDGMVADITPLLQNSPLTLPEIGRQQEENPPPVRYEPTESFVRQLSGILALLCTMFQLDIIFVSGIQEKSSGMIPKISEMLTSFLKPLPAPKIQLYKPVEDNAATLFAHRIRADLLLN